MTEAEILEELALIKAAKTKQYEHAQKYGINGGFTERVAFEKLVARENYLHQMLDMVQNNGSYGCQQVVFGGRR